VNFAYTNDYRKDIDGLRAIAVISVIAFHFGFLPNGFLGVDVFFVISGYLITGIIYREMSNNEFSIVNFYLRRTRRILPLTLFIVLVALLIGSFVMLPDDFEILHNQSWPQIYSRTMYCKQ
jgi:peptidoglycan/LPS O-acetylase OafA/YrhL